MHQCAICRLLNLEPRYTTNVVGLRTRLPGLHQQLTHPAGVVTDREHVMVPACPEHVVDIYHGRIDGVAMAWRMPEPELTPVE